MQFFKKMQASTVVLVFACWALIASAAFEISVQVLSQVEDPYGLSTRDRIESWQRMISSPKSMPEDEMLQVVNSFFNQTKFVSDLEHWGQEDYWATPIELLASNGGDCEDYSIAKYFTLRKLGIPDEKLRITYVKALQLNQAHMVLAYYSKPDTEPLILDNLTSDIKAGSQRNDLFPIYSFNGDGLWLSKQQGLGVRVGRSDKLNRWHDLNQRMLKNRQIEL
jgi:predicted transglutaminase-like cysteine proteinase